MLGILLLQTYPLPVSKGNCVMLYKEADGCLLSLLMNRHMPFAAGRGDRNVIAGNRGDQVFHGFTLH